MGKNFLKLFILSLCLLKLSAINLQQNQPRETQKKPFILHNQQTVFQETAQGVAQDESLETSQEKISLPSKESVPIKEKSAPRFTLLPYNFLIIDFSKVFSDSPYIYTALFFLSTLTLAITFYIFLKLRTHHLLPHHTLLEIRDILNRKQMEQALKLCYQKPSIIFKMIASGIESKEQNPQILKKVMKDKGLSASHYLWQKLGLLNDIAMLAPMLGLLGTVMGMFYAFYGLDRSIENLTILFDGLGVSVGTTIGGLIVSILALVFHSIAKYRLIHQLNVIDAEAEKFMFLIYQQENNHELNTPGCVEKRELY